MALLAQTLSTAVLLALPLSSSGSGAAALLAQELLTAALLTLALSSSGSGEALLATAS